MRDAQGGEGERGVGQASARKCPHEYLPIRHTPKIFSACGICAFFVDINSYVQGNKKQAAHSKSTTAKTLAAKPGTRETNMYLIGMFLARGALEPCTTKASLGGYIIE